MSRRDARAQRSASAQRTVWSVAGASVASDPIAADAPVLEPVIADAAVASDPIPADAPVLEAPVAEAPVASDPIPAGAPVLEASAISEQIPSEPQDAESPAPAAPMTRASRRIRTRPTPVIDDTTEASEASATPDASAAPAAPEASAHTVPTAAIAWAVAAAAAAAAVQGGTVSTTEPLQSADEPFELLEPADVPAPVDEAESVEEAPAEASDVDEFEAAARLFAFTGETPVQSQTAPEPDVEAEPEPAAATHVAPRRGRRIGRQVATASFSVGVMGIVGLLTVGMTTPADAVAAVTGTEPTSLVAAKGAGLDADSNDIQAYVAPEGIENVALDRNENYSTVSMGELAAEEGITNYSNFYVNDPNAAIQWPFKVGVGITFGFGMRDGRMHEGADFVPGQGADVQAIADGTVRIATNSGGAYGVTVVIDHIIDGQLVSSRYAHMLYGSLKVKVGDHVTVGTILGNTGNTGRSFGAHTHFEILQNGTTAIDPIVWLRANAGRYDLG